MENWQEDLLSITETATDEQELYLSAKPIASKLGFDYFAYGMRMPLPITNPKTIMLNNYPEIWQQQYAEKSYIAIDPTVHHCMQSLRPLLWSNQLASTQAQRDFWEEASSYGLCYGMAQACRDGVGTQGMLTLARSSEEISQREQKEHYTKIFWLAHTLHTGIADIVNKREIADLNISLSDREVEVLRWTAEGKTAGEIASILNLTKRTVDFHVSNATKKLNATNKISAAIRALTLGLL